MIPYLTIYLYQQITRLFINPVFIILQYSHDLMESTVIIPHPFTYRICGAKKLFCHTFCNKHPFTSSAIFGQRHYLSTLGILHTIRTEYISPLCLYKLVILRMYLQCVIEVFCAIPRRAVWEAGTGHQSKAFHFRTVLHQAGNTIQILLLNRSAVLGFVILTMQFIIVFHIKGIRPFLIITGINGKIGCQYINRIDYRPEKKAHDHQFHKYPTILPALIP